VPERQPEKQKARLGASGADRRPAPVEESSEQEVAHQSPSGDGQAEELPVGAHQYGIAIDRRVDVTEARVRSVRRDELAVNVKLSEGDDDADCERDPKRPLDAG